MLENRNKREGLCLKFPWLLSYWSGTNEPVWPMFLTVADFQTITALGVSCSAATTQQLMKWESGAVLSVDTLNSGCWTAMVGLISSNFNYLRCIHWASDNPFSSLDSQPRGTLSSKEQALQRTSEGFWLSPLSANEQLDHGPYFWSF